MDFAPIVETFEQMEQTSSRLALTEYLVALLRKTPPDIIDKVTYLIQGKLYPDYEGIELGVAERMVIRAIASSSGKDQLQIEKLYQKTGDLGDAAGEAMKSKSQSTLFSEPMTVERVYSTFDRVARTTGPGSQETKLRLISSLLNDATAAEGRYIIKFVMGQLRLGIADYTVLDALAVAFTGDKANRQVLENAYNVSSDLGTVARLLATKGLDAVKSIKITLFKPIRPMLAERIRTAEEALERMEGKAAVEYKLDGERVQLHKGKQNVELFSRRLEKITSHYPDVAEAIKSIKSEVILEGEVVAINAETGDYLPFQELMHRRRKYGVEEAMENYPVVMNFFDVLYVDGKSKTELTYMERRKLLKKIIDAVKDDNKVRLIEQTIATKPEEIDRFMAAAIEDGCEGVMIKQLSSTYRAGAREYAWVKLKREYRSDLADTLDLVVVGALHGRGRRTGKYGALLLAAYDQKTDMFQSVTKVGTGFTDVHLEQFYNELEKHIINQRHARVQTGMDMDVWFEPNMVIEVIASEITLSPSHAAALNALRPGYGLALRFPKFTGKIRDDKKPEDATATEEIVEMYRRQLKVAGPSYAAEAEGEEGG
ncbi:DNA ligase [Candidatus Nitrososphaera gargensis Ga9.2]|uniref:DNA ligase n=1 Tax=Nitrososphaera gargensis (strain Ga9.2) TaxID=1237085 RepID=K0ICR2_NITGG|nr:ATP-dependent DNA ligase [Candidatus Nitrososphaera gargensis]AFU59156.1 DNA ligase [Candidatus Nitrososphaera gargensis Ga9.2]